MDLPSLTNQTANDLNNVEMSSNVENAIDNDDDFIQTDDEHRVDATATNDIDLLSFEKLDRASPELWPQIVPGINEFAMSMKSHTKKQQNQASTNNIDNSNVSKWMSDLNRNDIELLNDLSHLTTSELMDKVKDLIDVAYQLGVAESNQMTRGRLLNILEFNK